MEESRASQTAEATPIFGAYRRGYDPEQVDRYVATQQRRLDESLHRASEAERKLAAAVGQLRELHRRVAALEDQRRPSQTYALDGVGEHIQRIFEEAREGADALREKTEVELAELREKTAEEAQSILASARSKAEGIEADIEQRRREQLGRLEEDRSRAVTQLTYLHEQRKNAVLELRRLRDIIDSAIAEVSTDEGPATAAPTGDSLREELDFARRTPISGRHPSMSNRYLASTRADPVPSGETRLPTRSPVRNLTPPANRGGSEAARLVREHRAAIAIESDFPKARAISPGPGERRAVSTVFDFEEH
jgi:cell division septum initiation protein DivIVA